MVRFSMVAVVIALSAWMVRSDASAMWVLQSPSANQVFNSNATVAAAGMTTEANTGFTVYVYDNWQQANEVVMNSVVGTSGMTSFTASVAPPAGGWTVTAVKAGVEVKSAATGAVGANAVKFQAP